MCYRYFVFFVAIWGCFNSVQATAQDFKTDVQKVQQQYINLKNFHAQFSINVLDMNTKAYLPDMSKKGEIKMNEGRLWYKMDKLILLKTKTMLLLIDQDQKIAIYGENSSDAKSTQELILPDMDDVFKNYEKVEYKGIVGNDKFYNIKFVSNSPYLDAQIYIDKDLMLVHKIVYTMKKTVVTSHVKVDLTFSGMTTTPSFAQDVFSEVMYVQKKGGSFLPINLLKGYQLVVANNSIEDFK